ncbi:MAG: alpha-2,8-polysialyltransferase family protein [Gammaproteobacteria bacterium]|nr:alpha-2,8-polysialyltransferase family protein [Gammaproteobacteria bacterium]
MKNIFLVKSPLQLLNAIEAKHYFNLDDESCVLIIMGDRKSYPQMIGLAVACKQWNSIILMNSVGLFFGDPWVNIITDFNDSKIKRETLLRSSFFTIWRLNRMVKKISNIRYIFIGDYNYVYMRHFVNSVKHDKTVLLDDGTATVGVAQNRSKNKANNLLLKKRKRIKLFLKRMFLGLKKDGLDKICFFSAYKIKIGENDELINNNFNYIKSISQYSGVEDSVYFLGSPLNEVGVMTEKSYLDQLAMVKAYFNGQHVVYVAHRREESDKLDKIRKELNMEIRLFDYPIEYQIAILGPKPRVLASFVTSALENLRLIMGDKLKIISFKLIDGTYARQDRMNEIYDYYNGNISSSFLVEKLTL